MTKYRVFTQAYIYPKNMVYNADETFTIHIPEHVTYDSKQEAETSNTRWDYSFGLNNKDVVILIRHITVIDNTYEEIRSMPEFYYDYNTFIKLGGWIEHITKTENAINIDRIHENFTDLFPNLLSDNKVQIHIEPIDVKTCKCQETIDIHIPVPVSYIIQNNYVPVGNNNCNRPLVDDSFYRALSAFEQGDLKSKNCYIAEDYISVHDFDNENSEELFYDSRIQRVVGTSEWMEHCYEYTVEQKRKRKNALEKHGLLDAFNSLKMYLKSHNSIRTICYGMNEELQIIEKDLTYGYKLTGFEIQKNIVIWVITTYERPIKQNDCIRGLDDCYLMFKEGITVEAARKIDYQMMHNTNNIPENDYYNNGYIDISNIL